MPSLATVRALVDGYRKAGEAGEAGPRPTLVPVYRQLSSDLLTPSAAYLKVAAAAAATGQEAGAGYSFLFESAATEQVGRWSFLGAGPRRVLATGPGHGAAGDPLAALERELAARVVAHVPGLQLPPMAGGAVGYVGYDCVRYFEPRTARPLRDVLAIPESLFMVFDTVVAFDRFYGVVKVISYVEVPPAAGGGGGGGGESGDTDDADGLLLDAAYARARAAVDGLVAVLEAPGTPAPAQPPVVAGGEARSNVGRAGYEAHVRRLKAHIVRGDIFQAVPSQRLARATNLHPFNVYRHLRTVNPSPYLFYVACRDFHIVGASPELLVKTEAGRVVTHPIAGTARRGATPADDARLADELARSLKDRAEHVMLVDLARNDINRVCNPFSVRVDRLMAVERFSHVQHLVSQVSGVLRPGKTRFDAFRSVFPAGTVSGAPKVRAMELIADLEQEKRGVYAGAVGYFGYPALDADARLVEGAMDTCIALRTMVIKDGVAYLQAGEEKAPFPPSQPPPLSFSLSPVSPSPSHLLALLADARPAPQAAASSSTRTSTTSGRRPSTSWAPTCSASPPPRSSTCSSSEPRPRRRNDVVGRADDLPAAFTSKTSHILLDIEA